MSQKSYKIDFKIDAAIVMKEFRRDEDCCNLVTTCRMQFSIVSIFNLIHGFLKLSPIQFPFDWYTIETNLTIFDRIRSKSNVRSGAT
jgi:hypothetical protein